MKEENICDHLHGYRFARSTDKTIHGTSSQETAMRRGQCLPDAGQHDEDREDEADSTTTEDVAQRHYDKIREAKRDDGDTRQHGELGIAEMEFFA